MEPLNYRKWESGSDANWYSDDPIVRRYAQRYLPDVVLRYVEATFEHTGALAAGPIDRRAIHTDREGAPRLIRYNRKGEEINDIWYNEGYLQTVRDGYGTGVVAYRYDEQAPERIPFFVNAILLYLLSEAETGFTCPVALTASAAFVLEKYGNAEQKQTYLAKMASLDPEFFEQGATFLTEIQGGSDVGATETVAVREGDHFRLTGEKWFASNADAGIAITLARVSEQPGTRGLGLFVMPRVLPDGTRNHVSIRRLKDKLGVRAVASGELILQGAVGYLIGEADKGFKYMAEALNVSRLDTAVAALAIARRAFLEAAIYTEHREAFGSKVADFPMVQETLVDMITEIEAGWAVVAQTIRAFDRVHTYEQGSDADAARMRILLSLAKYRCSELGVTAARRSLELHGGNGYIEEYVTARLLRDAIVNPVWEGTANIQSLEIIKNLQKGGASPFLEDLEITLAQVSHEKLSGLQVSLTETVHRLREVIEDVMQREPLYQSAVAKKLADYMYDVYAAVHLLEEAQYDLQTSGEGRRMLVLEGWLRITFPEGNDRGILSQGPIPTDVVKSLVNFMPFCLSSSSIPLTRKS